MTIARKRLVREGKSGVYHCMVRCVRQAYLCGRDHHSGQNYDHRKEWVRSRLEKLSGAYGVDVLAYSVMSNHLPSSEQRGRLQGPLLGVALQMPASGR